MAEASLAPLQGDIVTMFARLARARPRLLAEDPALADRVGYLAMLGAVQREQLLYFLAASAPHAVDRALADLRPVPIRQPGPGRHRRVRVP
jgi:hypothetical protein